jgi:hypothetical protein
MKTLLTRLGAVGSTAALVALALLGLSRAAPVPEPKAPKGLVVHEWGTFTSFSGADGVPAHFTPNNNDLPGFVYHQEGPEDTKAAYLERDGLVSMETPVLYFYTDKEMKATVNVDFAKGWITEWYPFATSAPSIRRRTGKEGQSIRWDVKLLAGASGDFAREEQETHYYAARATDAVPVQAEFKLPKDQQNTAKRGGTIVQQEKFLFYRGVGNFQPPVTVQALGNGKVRCKNGLEKRVDGLVLLSVHDGKVGFKKLDGIDAGGQVTAALPQADGDPAELSDVMVKELTEAGLYEKEAKAMVKTWDGAWFEEEGTRLLYLVPRSRTDELLRLTIDPKPAEVVRVLVGRHDFLTPEVEAKVEKQLKRIQAAQEELQAADRELGKVGRFSWQARTIVQQRMEEKCEKK